MLDLSKGGSTLFSICYRHLTFVFLLLFSVVTAPQARAQTGANTGLAGTVSDPSGSAIKAAEVAIIRADTGEERIAHSDDSGNWEARFLSVGPYRVTVKADNFQTLTREGIQVTTGEMAHLQVQLRLGAQTETITVTADSDMASRNSATVVRELDAHELESLPTTSRNFTQLLLIEPGVSADISELLSNNNASISPSVNGARTTNNSLVFNGVDATNLLCCNSRINGARGTLDEGGGTLSRNIAPAPETLREVKLQTSLFDAATGRNGGGNFQLVSKSGTNEFHGSVYHFFQNDKLIGNDFFFNRAGLERQKLNRNEGGFTIGGPIAHNRTFFFGSYQATRARTAFVDEATSTARLPSALTSDRSDEAINRFASSIWDTDSLGPVNLSAIHPISRALLKAQFPGGGYLIPSGNTGLNCEDEDLGETCQVVTVLPATYEQDQFSVNIDHEISSSNRLSGKFFYTDQPSIDPIADSGAVSRFERLENTKQRILSLTDVHVFRPNVINELRVGFFRNRNDTTANPFFTNEQFGIISPLAGDRPDLALMSIDGSSDIGDEITFGTSPDDTLDVQNSFTYGDTLSFTNGRHSFKVGGEVRRHQLNGNLQEVKNGQIEAHSWGEFLTVGYANPEDDDRARQLTHSINYGETVRGFRMWDWNWFVADDWKVSPNLTLNIGVRHEFFGFPSEVNGFLSTFDYDAAVAATAANSPTPFQDGFVFAKNFDPSSYTGAEGLNLTLADTNHIVPNDYNNIMPRFGFAWTPFSSKNVVLRGGYGMFFERITGGFANSLRQSPPFFREAELDNTGDWSEFPDDIPVLPIPKFVVGFDDGEPQLEGDNDPGNEFEAFETQIVDPRLSTPYTQQWNLNLQWEFKPNWLFEFGYVGTKGTKLLQIVNVNQALDIDAVGFLPRAGVPGGGFSGNYFDVDDDDNFINVDEPPCDVTDDPGDCLIGAELRGPLLGFDEDEGANTLFSNTNSIYNSFQASLQKRYSQGHMFNINYTFSRSIDTFSDEGQFQIEHDQRRPFLNRGLSDFHRKHRLILSWSWDLPFRGNRFVEGWSISGIGTFQSGRPFTVVDNDYSGFQFASTNPRPDNAPGATHDHQTTTGSVSSRVDGYLNTSAFVSSGAQFGNLGRNTVFGPDQRRLDVSISKMTRLSERTSLEFRAEANNVSNTPVFRSPENSLTESSFGEIDRTRGGPRVIQLGLKLRF